LIRELAFTHVCIAGCNLSAYTLSSCANYKRRLTFNYLLTVDSLESTVAPYMQAF